MIKPIEFPEYTNAQVNAALIADKLNEVIRFLNEKYPDPNAFTQVRKLKEGVTQAKSGTFMLNGKFIKKEEAYA